MPAPLITIDRLKTYFDTDEGVVRAVDDISLEIPRGGTLGLVGESGSGKSVTALSVIRLVGAPGRIAGGSITLHEDGDGQATKDQCLTDLPEDQMRRIRGATISMIFQEPMTSLNPVFTVGSQIVEAIRLHQQVGKAEARRRAIEMLRKVKIPEPEQRFDEYPHQFSGGMRQRAMIAMALSCNPRLLIADEPTTALDVTIQAQILDLLRQLQRDLGMSILMITHDLGIIAETADRVAVMYASKVVEQADVVPLFEQPLHPYTAALFRSRPDVGQPKDQPLETIQGMVPSPLRFPCGCKFHPRCPLYASLREDEQLRCREHEPELREIEPARQTRCHFAERLKPGS